MEPIDTKHKFSSVPAFCCIEKKSTQQFLASKLSFQVKLLVFPVICHQLVSNKSERPIKYIFT